VAEYVYRVCMTLFTEARVTCRQSRPAVSGAELLRACCCPASRLLREPQVREALRGSIASLFVDEFQDTDPMHLALLFLLVRRPALWRGLE